MSVTVPTVETPLVFFITDDVDAVDWYTYAACAAFDNSMFFTSNGEGIGWHAKRVCAGCPVIDICLDFAVTYRLDYGVFGGMNARERRLHRYAQERNLKRGDEES